MYKLGTESIFTTNRLFTFTCCGHKTTVSVDVFNTVKKILFKESRRLAGQIFTSNISNRQAGFAPFARLAPGFIYLLENSSDCWHLKIVRDPPFLTEMSRRAYFSRKLLRATVIFKGLSHELHGLGVVI